MKILVLGNVTFIEEFKLKFNTEMSVHQFTYHYNYDFDEAELEGIDVVFDYYLDESPENLEIYKSRKDLTVFAHAPKMSLIELYSFYDKISCTLFGFNGFPKLLNREYLETSLIKNEDKEKLNKICEALGTKFLLVEDRVGMVTPRVIAMIINEAFYTVQEGTAGKEAIDQAMKLGTNYPYGPFEFCEMIGIKNIYELLEALYEDTKDERYKICPMLKRQYLEAT